MVDTIAFTQDPRRRNLLVLAVLACVAVALAVLALVRQSEDVAPHYRPAPFFPGLASELRDVARIRLVSKAGAVDVQFKPEKGWVVTSHDDYPAAFDRVRETLVGIAALETIEPKTARADWLHYLDLVPPPKGDGTSVTLEDSAGRRVAAVIAGKNEDIGDSSQAVGLFVRRPDSDQSWLVRSVFTPKADTGPWLDKDVLDVTLARIQEVDVNPATGASYEVRRDKPNVADLNLVDIPKGREIAYSGVADGVAGAITDFTFDDVRPARDFDFSDGAHAARLVARTFDGLVVTVHAVQQGQDFWVTVSADGTAGQPDVRRQARAIDAHATGWAYKLPADKGRQFMTTLENLLKPLPAKAAATPPAK